MLTKVKVEKIYNGVYISLTDHSTSIYKNTLWIVSKLVDMGYKIASISPYGSIKVETDDYKGVADCIRNYLEKEEYIESIEKNAKYTIFGIVEQQKYYLTIQKKYDIINKKGE